LGQAPTAAAPLLTPRAPCTMGDIEPELMARMLARTGMYASNDDEYEAAAELDNTDAFLGIEKTRDEDGTVDRVRDPPPELLPVLAAIREKAKCERVDIVGAFTEAGASPFGTMATPRFISALSVNFPRFSIEQAIFDLIVDSYGIGFQAPNVGWESIAWMDFCEDVNKAVDNTEGQVASRLAHARSARLSFANLAKKPDELDDL